MSKFFLTSILVLLIFQLSAQIRCGTERYDSLRRLKNSSLETKEQFENWMRLKLLNTSPTDRVQETQSTYTVPVVVHVIHNGEPIGTGSNISDAQVLSQIKVLNNDFQRLNSDASQTPSEFLPVAGSMSIQFVLAKQDPLGNPSTGIVRVNGGKSTWHLYEDTELKAKSYWPAEQYVNIWVTNFSDYLGFTQFPVSNLWGLENSPEDRLTDGPIIHYRVFGSIDDGTFDLETQYNKGRTLTHEIGHFFGLRHIWGDGTSCSATDYVDDTPPQIGSTFHCPTHPVKDCSDLAKMFQNYLDYTDDVCMNIFTQGQVARMDIVINNSPRRKSLLTSSGIYPPGNYALDLGIQTVQTPTTLECNGTHTPTITIRNFGNTVITQANIELKINGSVFQTKTVSLNLNPLTETQVSFNAYTSSSFDSKTYLFTILNVNGVSDDYSSNNTFTVLSNTAASNVTPYIENFETGSTNWNIINPDALIGWTNVTLSNGNKAIGIQNYNYENEGATDMIVSPVFDVSSVSGLLLRFKLAYAQYPNVDGDGLSVYIIEDCSGDLTNATRVYNKTGAALSTIAGTRSSSFSPSTSDWATQSIPLTDFIGSPNLRIAFVSRNGWGNNIYLDDIELIDILFNNLTVDKISEPSIAVCTSNVAPKIQITNNGTISISSINIGLSNNGSALPNQSQNLTLDPGHTTEITLNSISLLPGANSVSISINPNGMADEVPTDNVIEMPLGYIQNSATIPFRENFNTSPQWTIVNSESEGWVIEQTNYAAFAFSAACKGYSNTTIGSKSWLISPKINFSKSIEASLFADFSYGERNGIDEQVTLLASTNCGKTFGFTFFSNGASALGGGNSSAGPWTPSSANDWAHKYFNLDAVAGSSDVIMAFQVNNNNGNNFYLDNIEFFENDDPSPVEVSAPFRVYVENGTTYLTYNLEESHPSRVQVANIMGSILADETINNALNQTLTFKIGVSPAVYIFKVQIGNQTYAVRQYMNN